MLSLKRKRTIEPNYGTHCHILGLLSSHKDGPISPDNLSIYLTNHNTWISINVVSRVLCLGTKYLNVILEKGYRFNSDAFLYLLSQLDSKKVTIKSLKNIVLREGLMPSQKVNDTSIDKVEFLKDIKSQLCLDYDDMKHGRTHGRDIVFQKDMDEFWRIILNQYLYRISLPFLQVGFPPYLVLEIIDKLPFICDESHPYKIGPIIKINQSIRKIHSKRTT